MKRRYFLSALPQLALGTGTLLSRRASAADNSQETATRNLRNIQWSEGPHYPSFVKGGAMAAFAGAIVYAGGMTFPWRETEMGWFFEPDAKDWRPLPPMPEGRAYTSGVAAEDSFIVVGGRWQSRACKEAFLLRRLSRTDWKWEALPPLAQARAAAAVAATGSFIVAAGGGDWDRVHGGAFLPSEVSEVEGLDLKRSNDGWRRLAPFPGEPRAGAMAASAGGKIYIFGGYGGWYKNGKRHLSAYRDAFCYTPSADRWQSISSLPTGITGAATTTLSDRYIVIAGGNVQIPDLGGRTYQGIIVDPKRHVVLGQYSDRVLIYDLVGESYTWAEDRMPRGHNDVRLCSLGSRLYALGGENVDVTLSNTTNDFMIGEWPP